jgi:vesicle transport through interaction with t-SNAREs protein 1
MVQLDKANGNVGKSKLYNISNTSLTSSPGVDTVISTSVEIEGELAEAEGYLRAMDIEFRTMTSSDKRSAQQKVTEYREELKNLQQNYQTSKFNAESIALKSSPAARNKLLTANQKLDQSTATLEQSKQIISQTEKVGETIMTDMENQKEKLMDAKQKVKETRDFTSDARRVLRRMGHRAVLHKIFVYMTILGLAAAIVAVGYFGLVNK